MITIHANARCASCRSDDLLTTGSVGIPARFILSEEFNGLSAVAVFRGSGASVDCVLVNGACTVPHEVLTQAGVQVEIGVYARSADGATVIPTTWAGTLPILPGAEPSGIDPAQPTPDWTAQVQHLAADAYDMAEDVQARADRGEFDGERGPAGPQGPQGEPGERGPQGERGVAGPAGPQGDTGATGAAGPAGADGVSPEVSVADITGGHRVTITDADGTRTFDVMDGEPGQTGPQGIPGVPGERGPQGPKGDPGDDYVLTAQDKEDIAGLVDVPVQDVQVNGSSILSGGVANLAKATDAQVKAGVETGKLLVPSVQDASAFFGLAKAAGDATQSASGNAVGTYTDAAKVAIQKMLGIYEPPWELINEGEFTNETEADHIINVDSLGQAFELTNARMIFWLPQQNNAASKGSYGRVGFISGSNTDYCYCSAWTQAAGTPAKGAVCEIIQENGMLRICFTKNVTNASDAAITTNPRWVGTAAGTYTLLQEPRIYTSVNISAVLGTCRYKLFGRRKLN